MYSYTHILFPFSARIHPDKCCIINESCQKSHICWHNLSVSCLLECIASLNKLRTYEYSAIRSGSRTACQGFSGDPGIPSLMKNFYFTEILTKQYYAVSRIRVVSLWTVTPITRLYIQNLLKCGGSKKSNKLLKPFLHKHKSQWTFASKWRTQFDYTTLYCVQLALLWFNINISLLHHIWIWVLLTWGLLYFFRNI
jgi:hypothetical protein